MKKPPKRRPQLGRPPGPPEAVRSHRIVTFVTKAEMEKLDWLADRDAKALSAVVYEMLSNSLSEFGNKTDHPT